MSIKEYTLRGRHVRLEPLRRQHIEPLVAARAGDGELYAMSFVPQTTDAMRHYVETALAWMEAGHALAFATIRQDDDKVIGTSRFFGLERWARRAGGTPDHTFDTGEIGYTWLAPAAVRTAANTEAKLLMLTHAFETWRMQSVSFCTDARNARSRAAIERIGAQLDGILRAHRLATDFSARNSARYSIIAAEWPMVKTHIAALLARQ